MARKNPGMDFTLPENLTKWTGQENKEDKLLTIAALFLPLLFGGFFLLDTSLHRNLLYLSFPFMTALLIRDREIVRSTLHSTQSLWIWPAAFLAYMTLSVSWASVEETGRYFEKAKLILLIGLPVLASAHIFRMAPDILKTCLKAMTIAAIIGGITSLSQHTFILSTRLHGMGRAENPVQCALLYALAIFAIYFLPLQIKRAIWIKTACILFFGAIILLTQSRGPILALITTVCLLGILTASRKVKIAGMIGLTGLISLGVAIYVFLPELVHSTQFSQIFSRLSTGRLEIWEEASAKALEAPIIGHGLASKFYYTFHVYTGSHAQTIGHPHNLYLSTLIHGGLIGVFLLAGALISSLRTAVRLSDDFLPKLCLAFLLSGSILGLVDFGGYVINLSTEWLVFWWPIALLMARESLKNKQNSD